MGARWYTSADSPIGRLVLTRGDEGLRGLYTDAPEEWRPAEARAAREPFADALEQLDRYWSGEPVEFTVTLEPAATEWQARVRAALLEVPFGETITYSELAARSGRGRAARAAGRACGSNPIAIVVPCHRVVGGDGRLVGYAGGVARKRALLEHERAALGAA